MAFNYELEVRLRNWAKWVIKVAEGGFGYPTESIIACFSKYGFIPKNNNRSSSNLISSPREEEINTIINQMALQFPQYSTAIYNHYISKQKQAEIAKSMGISTRTFRVRVEKAKLWMHAKMCS